MQKKQLAVWIPEELKALVVEEKRRSGTPLAEFVRRALAEKLVRLGYDVPEYDEVTYAS